MAQRWVQQPAGSRWGEFGADDQRGRMNLVTPRKVLQGVAEVKSGRSFVLSLPLDVPGGQSLNPRRMPPRRYAVIRDGKSAGQQGFCSPSVLHGQPWRFLSSGQSGVPPGSVGGMPVPPPSGQNMGGGSAAQKASLLKLRSRGPP